MVQSLVSSATSSAVLLMFGGPESLVSSSAVLPIWVCNLFHGGLKPRMLRFGIDFVMVIDLCCVVFTTLNPTVMLGLKFEQLLRAEEC